MIFMKYKVKNPTSLLSVLEEMSPDSSKNTLRSWLQAGRVTVDDRRADRANLALLPGQEVIVGPKVAFIKGSVRILYEDDAIVVLEKPEGLLSVATDSETKMTVHSFLKRRFHNRRVYPVHRLDRETSGIMLFAYSEKAKEDLRSQFEEHQIEKTYIAVVEKEMPRGKGAWESYLEEDDFYYVKSVDPKRGKLAITRYEVLEVNKGRSLLRLYPKTGRKNQIRVHCTESGYPIVGDKKYSAKTNPAKRMCLHAQKISFTHPTTKKKMTFEAAIPEIFYSLVEKS